MNRERARARTKASAVLLVTATLIANETEQAQAASPPVHLNSFGTCGSGRGQFGALWGIAAGPGDVVYIADEQLGRVIKFNCKTGDVLTTWTVANAFDVATTPDGSVYVLKRSAARIDHYSDTGSLLASFGAADSGDGQFSNPHGISVDPLGQVFVADTGNHRIQRLAADGTFLGKWGTQGGQIGEPQLPDEIAADNFGNVFVGDSQLGRIHRFSKTGSLLGWWYLGGPQSIPDDAQLRAGGRRERRGVRRRELLPGRQVHAGRHVARAFRRQRHGAGAVPVRDDDRGRLERRRLRLRPHALPREPLRRAAGAGPTADVGAGQGDLPLTGYFTSRSFSARMLSMTSL